MHQTYTIMEPSGVPTKTLTKAKTMRAELLIQTNKAWIIRWTKIYHNVNLDIDTSMSPTQNVCVCMHMQHVATSDVLNTLQCMDSNTDILQQLNDYIHEEIEQLYDYILHTLGNHHVVCYICGQPAHCA